MNYRHKLTHRQNLISLNERRLLKTFNFAAPPRCKMAVQTIADTENYIVVNKPYDMYINSDDKSEKNTVTYHIGSTDSHLASSANPLHFVHRLDFATSGVLFIAKNKKTAALAGRMFEKRQAKKYYLAVVLGHMKDDLLDIHYPIGTDPLTADSSHRMVAFTGPATVTPPVEGQTRDAYTRLLVLELGYYDKDPVTVILLKPITGRRHQLRVHCAAIGRTIRGDYTYSDARDDAPHRMMLHARRLVLPFENEPLDIQTPEPFFTDAQFTAKWTSEKELYKYRSDEDFAKVCDIVDKSYVLGVKYKVLPSIE